MNKLTSIGVFLFSAIALVVPSGFSLGAALLLLGSAGLLRRGAPRPALDREDRLLIAALTAYFAVNVVLNLFHGAAIAEYDPPLRFVLAVPVLLLLLAYPPRAAAFWSGIVIGGIGAGLYAGVQFLFFDETRAGGTTNPIQYCNISMLFGVLCLCGLSWSRYQTRARVWLIALGAGAVMGIVGAIFTGSRGGWIALPVCLLVAVRFGGATGKRLLVIGTVLVCSVIAVLWLVPGSPIKARTEMAVSETSSYVTTGETDTSVGTRLEMWRIGLTMLPQRWLAGWGKEGMIRHKTEMVQQKLAGPTVIEHTHLHNEYLDALVKRGLLGLLALLGLFLTPLFLFFRHLRHQDRAVREYALAGTLLYVCYLTYGLTQAFLTHNNGVMELAFMTVILWSSMRSQMPAQTD